MLMRIESVNLKGFPRSVPDGVICTREWERKKRGKQTYKGKVPRDFVPSVPCEVKDGKVVRVAGTGK